MNIKNTPKDKFQEMWQTFVDVPSNLSQVEVLAHTEAFWRSYEALIAYNKKKQLCAQKTLPRLESCTCFAIDARKRHLLWRTIFRDQTRQMFTIWVLLASFSSLVLIFSGFSANMLFYEIVESLKIVNILILLPYFILFLGRIQAKTSVLNTVIKVSPEQVLSINPMSKPDCVNYDQLVDIQHHALGLCLIRDDALGTSYGDYEALVIPYALKDFDKAMQQIYFYWENSKAKLSPLPSKGGFNK